jgi:ribosomal protein S18 acetylase RimI-like enzyme
MKLLRQKYSDGGEVAAAVDRAAAELELDWPGSYVPSERDETLALRCDEGAIVSLIVWTPWSDAAFIGIAWTRKDRRRRGHYRQLLEILESDAAALGLTAIRASVNVRNEVSLSTHAALGMPGSQVVLERAVAKPRGRDGTRKGRGRNDRLRDNL